VVYLSVSREVFGELTTRGQERLESMPSTLRLLIVPTIGKWSRGLRWILVLRGNRKQCASLTFQEMGILERLDQ
jgi:hypothetical protein